MPNAVAMAGLVLTLLLGAGSAVAADAPWLLGTWEGIIESFSGKNPGRTMTITSVNAGGTVTGRWAIAGGKPSKAAIVLDGDRVTVTTSADSLVQLTRARENRLEGHFTLKDGRSFPLTLTRVQETATAPPVSEAELARLITRAGMAPWTGRAIDLNDSLGGPNGTRVRLQEFLDGERPLLVYMYGVW